MGRFGQVGKVERGVGHSRAPISFVYYMSGSKGTLETVRVKVRPGEFDAWRMSRLVFVRDRVTGKREQELSTFEDLEDAYTTLEASGKYLWV